METAFAIFLDGKVRPWTVRSTARQCREDYVKATRKRWRELLPAGFRCRKITLLPANELPPDVRRLVIVARRAFDLGYSDEEFHELDKALEAFSARVPYDSE
jgi:hypothetical protein